jgi:hypothetical protein
MTDTGAHLNEAGVSGADQATWIECRIEVQRQGRHGEFLATSRRNGARELAGRSERFRWSGPGDEPPRTRATEDRVAELYRTLRQHGWLRKGGGEPEPWYQFSFHALVPSPVEQVGLEQPADPEVESAPMAAAPAEELLLGSGEIHPEETQLEVSEVLEEPPPEPVETARPKRRSAPLRVATAEQDGPVTVAPKPVPARWYLEEVAVVDMPFVESELLTRIGAYSAQEHQDRRAGGQGEARA